MVYYLQQQCFCIITNEDWKSGKFSKIIVLSFIDFAFSKILESNIEFVVEYNRDRPLKEFVETMTRNRMQATKDGIDALSQLYKVGFEYKSDLWIIFSARCQFILW